MLPIFVLALWLYAHLHNPLTSPFRSSVGPIEWRVRTGPDHWSLLCVPLFWIWKPQRVGMRHFYLKQTCSFVAFCTVSSINVPNKLRSCAEWRCWQYFANRVDSLIYDFFKPRIADLDNELICGLLDDLWWGQGSVRKGQQTAREFFVEIGNC